MKLYIPMFALLLILSSSMVSAVGETSSSLDSNNTNIEVNTWWDIPLLSSSVANATLITPHYNIVPVGDNIRIAEFNVTALKDYSGLLDGIKLFDVKRNNISINRDYYFAVESFINKTVPTSELVCPNDYYSNGSKIDCYSVITGSNTYLEPQWTKVDSLNLVSGQQVTVGIFMNMYEGDIIEWIPNIAGADINQWAITASDSLLHSYWNFDEGTGNNVNDSVFPQHNLSNAGTGVGWAGGIIGSATDRGTTGTSVDTGYSLSGTTAVTLNAWVNRTGSLAGASDSYLFGAGNDNPTANGDFRFGTGNCPSNTLQFGLDIRDSGSRQGLSNCTNIAQNNWTMITLVFNSTLVTVYFNDVKNMSYNLNAFAFNVNNLKLFANGANAGPMHNALADNIGVWNRSLSQSEIDELWNSSHGIEYPFSGGGGGGSPLSMVVNLNIPANNSVTGNTSMAFNTNATVTNGNLTNVTLYVQNSGLFTNFTTVTGASNITLLSKSGIANGVKYNWTVQYCAQNSTTVLCQYAPANFTFTGNFGTPNVSIKFPTNTTYNTPGPTGINITTSPDVTTCWYSTNNWATNTTFTCASNVSGLVANNGSNTWMVGVNNSAGSLNMTNVTFSVIIPFNLTVSLTTPPDSSTTTSSALTFNSSAAVSSGNLVNATLYVWNGSMQFTNLTSVTGNSTNTTSIGKGNLSTGSYTWNVQYCAQNSSNTLCVFGVNRTFTEVSAPTLALTQVCHQEFTNRTPSCVGYGNGTYANANPTAINGVWNDNSPPPSNMLMNYTLAPGALNDSIWAVQPVDNLGHKYIYNLTMTDACWSEAQLLGSLNLKANVNLFYCFNGTGYDLLFNAGINIVGFSEEAMNWSISILKENSQTFTPSVPALTNNAFLANITWNKVYWTGINAVLTYNNTVYQGTLTNVGPDTILNASVVTPSTSSAVVVPFYWTVYLTNSSGTFAYNLTLETQTVGTISIDDCSANTLKILNLTMFDEDTNSFLNISNPTINGSIAVTVRLYTPGNPSVYSSYSTTKSNTNPVFICLPAGNLTGVAYGMDADVQYSAGNRVTRWNYLRGYYLNATTAPDAIILRDLLTTESQEFKITYKDNTFLLVPNVVIDIEKYYVGQGFFATVENGLTDNYGTTIGHFVLGTNNYLINVYQNGNLVSSFPDIQPVCNNIAAGDCQINLQALTSAYQFTNWQTANNLNYNYNFNEAGRQLTLTWALQNQLTGSSDVHLIVSVADVIGNQTACDIDSTGTFGVYTCNINQSFGNTTVAANLYKDGQFVSVNFFTITNGEQGTFGNTGLLLALVFVICLALMFTSSPTMAIVGGTFGLIVVGLLNLINMSNNTTGNSILAYSSGLVFIVVAATAIIYKINKSNGGIS